MSAEAKTSVRQSVKASRSHAPRSTSPNVPLRAYQLGVFVARAFGIIVLHWSRQIGKSYTLAAWAVDRLLARPGRLVTILSNSRENGAELNRKVAEMCRQIGVTFEQQDLSADIAFQNMNMETRITVNGKVGRIKVLAASPRTARGFSGDLLLDEFAFHENSQAIWEAASPILDSNPDFLCIVSSTGNGKHNMFYRMASGLGPSDGTFFTGAAGFPVSRVTRTAAHAMGVKIYDPVTRAPITPDEARRKSLDKAAYDQNYECAFADENMALLTEELICAAERDLVTVDEQEWSPASIARMYRAQGRLDAGQDFGRNRDLSVICVLERDQFTGARRIIAMLRMSNMRSPAQQKQLDIVCGMPKFARACIDMTGNGLGLTEYAQEKWGLYRVVGINFATTEPINDILKIEGRKQETARVTENMATEMCSVFEDHRIEIPNDRELHDDLRKPERLISPGGRVSIAATRDEAGHADHFWSIALAIRAGAGSGPAAYSRIPDRPQTGASLFDRVSHPMEVYL